MDCLQPGSRRAHPARPLEGLQQAIGHGLGVRDIDGALRGSRPRGAGHRPQGVQGQERRALQQEAARVLRGGAGRVPRRVVRPDKGLQTRVHGQVQLAHLRRRPALDRGRGVPGKKDERVCRAGILSRTRREDGGLAHDRRRCRRLRRNALADVPLAAGALIARHLPARRSPHGVPPTLGNSTGCWPRTKC